MLGTVIGNALMWGALAICSGIAAVVAIGACVRFCLRCCRLQDCAIMKRLFLCLGRDSFDDFNLVVLVHEVMFDSAMADALTTIVQVTAGAHIVRTDPSEDRIFQQPLHITVEQGTDQLIVALLTTNDKVLATTTVDVCDILGEANSKPELVYHMRKKVRGLHSPKIKLTMVANSADDPEVGTGTSRTSILVQQQLKKVSIAAGKHGAFSMDVLKQSCAGPLELFDTSGLGKKRTVYVAVTGTPMSRRWILGIWRDERAFAEGRNPVQEVGLLKIQSIQADPNRSHIFVMNFFDQVRQCHILIFRRIDRNRDVWVEILQLLVTKVHEEHKRQKKSRSTPCSKVSFFQHAHQHAS